MRLLYPSKRHTDSCSLQAPDGRIIKAEYGVGVDWIEYKYLFWFRIEDFQGLHWCKDFYIEPYPTIIEYTVNLLSGYLYDGKYRLLQFTKVKQDIMRLLNEVIIEISLKKHKLETSNSQTCKTIEKEQRSLF